LQRAQAGDLAAREELARGCGRAAYGLALQLLRDPDAAADVAQDALLRFFSSLDRVDPSRPVLPWLFRIVRNRIVDLHRRRGVRRTTSLDAHEEGDGGELAKALVEPRPGPDVTSARSELARSLWRCLARLDDKHREILVLRDYQDLSYREIADVVGIPHGTVMSRLHTARRRLREEVLASGHDFGETR
jgi:RNA polymerase sigma-70 factor (ECF subfamily)